MLVKSFSRPTAALLLALFPAAAEGRHSGRQTPPEVPPALREAVIESAYRVTRAGQGGEWEEAQLTASDPTRDDYFGWSASVSGDTAVVGAIWDDPEDQPNAGSAYVFVRSGTSWTEQARLTASDAAPQDYFGISVALSGDTAVIGARSDDHAGGTEAGSAYVYVRSGTSWTEQAKLTAGDPATNDWFGTSVSISGDTAVVGASGDDHGDPTVRTEAGSAYVFVRSGTAWAEQAKLTASDPAADDAFGTSVSLAGDTALVGAYMDDHSGGTNVGSAYVFVRSGTAWAEQAKLTASDPASHEFFGNSVSLSDGTALVGAFGDDHAGGTDVGSAYVFVQSGTSWTEQAKLTASDPASGDGFAHAVGLAGDTAAIGAPWDDHAGYTDPGSVYVFVRSGTSWTEHAKLTDSEAEHFDIFGYSVGLAGDTVVIGAYRDDLATVADAGSAYVFRLCPPPMTYCTAGTSASGCQAALSASGIASASAPSGFDLMAANVEGSKDGLFFFGTNGRQANSWGNGTSFQCVVPPVKRLALLAGTGTTGACAGSFSQDLNGVWCPTCPSPQKNPGVGALVQAQLWYRDPLSTSNQTTSLSDAIEFCLVP